ncbi:oxidoreductase [Natronobacterium texcoconense]|uniref:NAD(P)-dependent dehydrogenase, short-chain alcohol dehydrogenase family n=1 Tax=Natronobacterium texcoconense TaxID=1095778 RepID=A0A1H1FWN6_NATTX|nr:oxidoreductase [Natronobacterium texcoconense]SDR05352.1 NAD(P)-dependent dehydrogenase, short-chain alcohol dehydrogenase family [Natronobacterium texcoconense]
MGWTEADVPNQRGQTVVVTGANSGIGYEATRMLAEQGATVVMACRSVDRGRDAAMAIKSKTDAGTLVVVELDLANLESVRTFPDRLARSEIGGDGTVPDVDVLINNAGVMAIPRRETVDGFEMQFGVNHLGHFALTGTLLDSLAAAARVVTVSSMAHEGGEIDFDDLHGEEYGKWTAYGQSKLANLLFAYELDRRLEASDRNVTSVAVHPGLSATNLQARGPKMAGSTVRLAFMRIVNALFAQSAASGALPTVYAATASDVDGGEYYGPGGFLNVRGAPDRQESAAQSHDRETARKLWQVSAEQTGVAFDLPTSAVAERDDA